jgi:ubiquinone biosynthesis protein
MLAPLAHIARLARAGIVLARWGVDLVPKGMPRPFALHLARWATAPIRLVTWPLRLGEPKEQRMAAALTRLGPSYVKLGQFLATRADVIGPELAADLRHLQDRMAPFPTAEARATIEAALGGKLEDHFVEFGPPIAAASIAQVHKAIVEQDGVRRAVAVKILRPDVERRFRRDLASWAFAADLMERLHAPLRRLKPTAVVDTLARTTRLEMDLRLEAAALSELAENIAGHEAAAEAARARAGTGEPPADAAGTAEPATVRLRVPSVDWRRTAERVLTIEWIDGTPISDRQALLAQGHDLRALGLTVLRTFLVHAMQDGFFHADMHHGNLLVEKDGSIVAVDLGIMGRLGPRERRFLAEILHGLITRDYRRAAEVHFWAGYVPPHHPVEVFAQALRAIGEPIHGRKASEISMADLLGQLLAYTEVFDMQTRTELVNLQKTMVVVEGVARSLDPELDIWTAAEPIARAWVEEHLGPAGRLREAGEGAGTLGRALGEVPGLLLRAEQVAAAFADMAQTGVTLDAATVERLAAADARRTRSGRTALWLGALALTVIAATLSRGVFW